VCSKTVFHRFIRSGVYEKYYPGGRTKKDGISLPYVTKHDMKPFICKDDKV
jgi:hypothetical protein